MVKDNSYITIGAGTKGKTVVKKSIFISLAVPVGSLSEMEERLREIRKEYQDARHVCYGCVFLAEDREFRSSDGGEPSGTAGRPILGVLRSHGLTNVLIAVVRYFGGIKLGTGGLVVAYRGAAEEALATAEILTVTVEKPLDVTLDYAHLNEVMILLKRNKVLVVSKEIDTVCRIRMKVKIDLYAALSGLLSAIPTVKIDC